MARSRPVIIWSDDEWDAILKYGQEHWNPGGRSVKTIREQYDEAQTATLEPARRRPFDPAAQSYWSKTIQARIAGKPEPVRGKGKPKREKLPARTARPPEEPTIEVQAPPAEPVVTAPPASPSLAPDPLADLFARSFEPVLLKMLEAPQVKEKILAIIAEHYLPKVVTQQPSGAKIIQLNKRPRLPKIVIVTKLKGHQTARLASEFTGLLNLYIWNTSRSIQELKNNLMQCDVAVCTVNNVSHGAMQMAKSRAPAFVACQAGIETIRKELLELIPGELTTKESKA